MLNRRFAVLAKKDGAPFVSAGVSVSEDFNFFHDASVDVTCKSDQWEAALAVGEQELRRALDYGFTDSELKEAANNYANELDQAVKTASTRLSRDLAGEIAQSLVDGNVFTAPTTDLALLKPALQKITPKDCLDALRAAFAANGRYVMVDGNAQIPGDAAAASPPPMSAPMRWLSQRPRWRRKACGLTPISARQARWRNANTSTTWASSL